MIDERYAMAYSEVLAILKYISEEMQVAQQELDCEENMKKLRN